jgi:spermidine/putrescine transport system permease protein
MATDVRAPAAAGKPAGPVRTPRKNPARWFSDHVILMIGILVLVYMFVPIGYIFALSFNQPTGKSANAQFEAFTWNNWSSVCDPEGLCDSLKLSIEVSITATIFATLLGTLMAFALVRHSFRGRGLSNLLIFLPMATPEVVMGSSLLTLFVNQASPFKLGFWTIAIAHIMFDISFVVVTVKARLQGLDPRLEQAAMDLYATPAQTLRRVTLPLVMPGIVAAALLAFALSFDDFIITDFNAGSVVTFPMFVYGAHQRGVPPQINVIGRLTFFLALALTAIGQLGRGRASKRHA